MERHIAAGQQFLQPGWVKKFISTFPATRRTEAIPPQTGQVLANGKISGWAGVGLTVLSFAALYLLHYLAPLGHTNYTTRIWAWTLLMLSICAGVVITFVLN